MLANLGYPWSKQKTKLILLIVFGGHFLSARRQIPPTALLGFIFLVFVDLKVYAERTENAKENRYLKRKNDIEQNFFYVLS